MYKEQLQPSTQTTQVRDAMGNIVDVKYKGIPNIQKLNADANALEFNTNFVNVGDKVYETFPEEIANPFENDPKFKIAQKRLVKILKSDNEALKEAPESVVNSIATTELTKRFASGETADITRSYDTQKMINEEKQRAKQNARADEQLAIAKRRDLRDAARHENIMKENPFTPMGDLSLIVSGTLEEKGRPLIENSRKILAKKYGIPTDNEAYTAVLPYLSKETKQEANDLITKGNIAQVGSLVKMVDLSAANKGKFDDYTKRAAYRLISVTDNNTNKVHLIKLYPSQPEIDAAGNPKTDKKTGEVIMRNLPPEYVKDIEGQMLYLQNQMLGTPQKVKEEIVTPYTISPEEEN
jgi:hypothetical protein